MANFDNLVLAFEWGATLFGLLGAFLLATHSRFSRWGWPAFLVANLLMISFALALERHGLLVQQMGFMVTSFIGMWRAGLIPLRGLISIWRSRRTAALESSQAHSSWGSW